MASPVVCGGCWPRSRTSSRLIPTALRYGPFLPAPAMAVVMAVEEFAAAGSVAGLSYDETECAVANVCPLGGLRFKSVDSVVADPEQTRAEEERAVPIMAIDSRNDGTVSFENGQNGSVRATAAALPPPCLRRCSQSGQFIRAWVGSGGRDVSGWDGGGFGC